MPLPDEGILPPELLTKHTELLKAALVSNKRRQSPGVILGSYKNFRKQIYPFMGCILGFFEQGPLTSLVIDTVDEFYYKYGLTNTVDSLASLSYLQYAPHLLVKRVIGKDSFNAYASAFIDEVDTLYTIKYLDDVTDELILSTEYIKVFAQTPGAWGNKISIAMFTYEELELNKQITPYYKAKNITSYVPYLNYCVAVFFDNKLVEVLTVPINQLEDVNTLSNYVYIKSNIFIDVPGIYDGNRGKYDGLSKLYDGGSTLYDGTYGFFDGNICFIDGNVMRPLFCVPKLYAETLMYLKKGSCSFPTREEFLDAMEEFDNPDNFDIDLCIANNIPLSRADVVNIAPVAGTYKSAIDSAELYIEEWDFAKDNTMFIFGQKKVGKLIVNLNGDYCGLRAGTVLEEGLSVSTSKISKPFLLDDIVYNPKFNEQEKLYENMINVVTKDNGVIFCNGETMYKEL